MRSFLFFILGSILIVGCGKDESEGTTANILTDENQVYFQGDHLILEAIFMNDLGLARIEIVNERLDISFEKDLEGQIVYDLKLERELPILKDPEIHEVVIAVTDINGEVKDFSYQVDYVFHPRIFNMKFSRVRAGDGKQHFQGRVEDPHGIKSVQLYSVTMGFLVDLRFSELVHSYDLNEDFYWPPDQIFGKSPLTLRIVNQRNFSTTITDFEDILGG